MTLSRRARQHPRIISLVAGVAALAVVAGPILGTAHLAAVEHTVCPRDGELVEVHHTGPVSKTAPAALTRTVVRADESQVPLSGHGHEHCSFATHAASPTIATSRVAVASVTPDAGASRSVVGNLRTPAPVAVYRFAPKSSPPVS